MDFPFMEHVAFTLQIDKQFWKLDLKKEYFFNAT